MSVFNVTHKPTGPNRIVLVIVMNLWKAYYYKKRTELDTVISIAVTTCVHSLKRTLHSRHFEFMQPQVALPNCSR